MCIRDRDNTFQLIKDKFLEIVILRHPNFKKPFFLNCDASNISLGTTLYQEDEEGHHLVISFASRTLNQCEKNYNVNEKELLSVVFACSKFRTYILGYPVTAVSYTHLDVYKRQMEIRGRYRQTLTKSPLSFEFL